MTLLQGLGAVAAAVAGGLLLGRPAPDPAVAAMATAARRFLAALPPALQAKARATLDAPEWTQWNFVPGDYPGVQLKDLDAAQQEAAAQLLRAATSERGYQKATAIVALEDVLRALESREGRPALHRDRGRYAVLVFGDPRDDGTWGWRLQGHHVSLRFAVASGRFAGGTPAFLGSNPHELRGGERAGARVLGAEEDLARALLLLFDDTQRARAVCGAQAPPDILLGPARAIESMEQAVGLPWADMDAGHRAVLWRLIEEYAHNLRGEFAHDELQRIRDRGLDAIRFAWFGGLERGQGHYYRIHGPGFVIEYDNTQNGANHVHTVWRDVERDFGGDILRTHLREHQRERGK